MEGIMIGKKDKTCPSCKRFHKQPKITDRDRDRDRDVAMLQCRFCDHEYSVILVKVGNVC